MCRQLQAEEGAAVEGGHRGRKVWQQPQETNTVRGRGHHQGGGPKPEQPTVASTLGLHWPQEQDKMGMTSPSQCTHTGRGAELGNTRSVTSASQSAVGSHSSMLIDMDLVLSGAFRSWPRWGVKNRLQTWESVLIHHVVTTLTWSAQ